MHIWIGSSERLLFSRRLFVNSTGFFVEPMNMPLMNTSYTSNHFRFGFKCCICKKEGCEECTTWFMYDTVKYLYHEKCGEKLPKRVLKAIETYWRKKDREDIQHYLDYPLDHI